MLISVSQLRRPIAALIFFASASLSGATSEFGSATEVVDRLHASLLETMRASDLDFQGRFDMLDPIIEQSFDFATIARIVMGRHWKNLSEIERARFVEIFTDLSTATYASRFDAFSGEQFRRVSEQQQKGDYRLVKTELIKSDGTPVELAYLLRESDDQWQIVNVIADGVSDLSLKRADYTSVIKAEGFDSLVAKLNNQLSKYKEEAS